MRSTIMVSSAFIITLFQVAPLHRTPRFFKRHVDGSLNQTGTSFAAASLKIGAKALRSPEDFIRNSSRKLASGKESPFILS
jgi:hypothetical protein